MSAFEAELLDFDLLAPRRPYSRKHMRWEIALIRRKGKTQIQ